MARDGPQAVLIVRRACTGDVGSTSSSPSRRIVLEARVVLEEEVVIVMTLFHSNLHGPSVVIVATSEPVEEGRKNWVVILVDHGGRRRAPRCDDIDGFDRFFAKTVRSFVDFEVSSTPARARTVGRPLGPPGALCARLSHQLVCDAVSLTHVRVWSEDGLTLAVAVPLRQTVIVVSFRERVHDEQARLRANETAHEP